MKLSIMLLLSCSYIHTYIGSFQYCTSILCASVTCFHGYCLIILKLLKVIAKKVQNALPHKQWTFIHTRRTTKGNRQLCALTLRSWSIAFFFLSSESSSTGTFLCSSSTLPVYKVPVGNPTMVPANIDANEDNELTNISPDIAVDGSGATELSPGAPSFPASPCCATWTPSVTWIQDNWWQSAQLLRTVKSQYCVLSRTLRHSALLALYSSTQLTWCTLYTVLSPNVARKNYHLLAVRISKKGIQVHDEL